MFMTSKIARTSMLAAPLAIVAGMATAGGLSEPVAAPSPAPVAVAPAPVMMGNDWTGFYVGGQLGYGQLDPNAATTPSEPDGVIYGVHAGYNYDFGSIVLGGEVDYDLTDISFDTPNSDLDGVARAKAKLGYDAGAFMPYITAGYAQAQTSDDLDGDTDGTFAGLGLSYMMSDSIVLGGEVLQHQFEDVADNDGLDVDATTLTLRASFKF
ncbi:opacity protein-like surface antigen [Loktanella sp. PT4BL]|jgi:opacity protein-like surface antigen|uniref:outer membrane protein n=1 Tax=Loktanella sp. PT4BL TaxID=2135611 RepID=UPI000D774B59|nr:outer membrane beta-barrel protein [Loktanella sp. PT4BL]PXW70604.1 opacity protein-like surface antigen [Loktanella sp. PT4BL]